MPSEGPNSHVSASTGRGAGKISLSPKNLHTNAHLALGQTAGRVQSIHDVPPAMIARIADLARNGNLGSYLIEQGYNGISDALPMELLSALSLQPNGDSGARSQTKDSRPRSIALGTDGVRSSTVPDETGLEDNSRELLSSLSDNTAGSSGDPYNTTVFVGGLSALIPEDTLRSFFAPFGDIHYVSVPQS